MGSEDMYQEVKKETEEAIEQGFNASKEAWRAMALGVIKEAALKQPRLSVNDIRPQIDVSKVKTHDKRALGGVMKAAQALGWIAPTGMFIAALNGHLRPQQLWDSKLYKTPEQLRDTIYRYLVVEGEKKTIYQVRHESLERFMKQFPQAKQMPNAAKTQ